MVDYHYHYYILNGFDRGANIKVLCKYFGFCIIFFSAGFVIYKSELIGFMKNIGVFYFIAFDIFNIFFY